MLGVTLIANLEKLRVKNLLAQSNDSIKEVISDISSSDHEEVNFRPEMTEEPTVMQMAMNETPAIEASNSDHSLNFSP